MEEVEVVKPKGPATTPPKPKPNGWFNKNFYENVGREVEVTVVQGSEVVKLSGLCEAVDFNHGSLILKSTDGTYMVRNYVYVRRLPRRKK